MSFELLSQDFLERYPDFPEHQEEISTFVYLRTYSRYLPIKKRRETWKETCARASQYNVSLSHKHLEKSYGELTLETLSQLRNEAETLFDNMFNLRQFLSGRTLWVGGSENSVAEKFPLANFNCSFTNIESLYDLCDLFYLLLIGTGVGFKVTPEMAEKLEPVRNDLIIVHDSYTSVYPTIKVPDSSIAVNGDRATIYVGDSKEGWVTALKFFLDVHTKEEYSHIRTLKINYDLIRKAGERLKTFGGTASGAEPMIEMFQMFYKIIHNQVDHFLDPLKEVGENKVALRPIHIVDMANSIGYNVVVGGVRRTAEIALGTDWEFIFAKYGINGIWDEKQHNKIIQLLRDYGLNTWADKLASLPVFDANARPLHHRRMSNNSVVFDNKPDRNFLNLIFEMMRSEGEPGFVNLRELARRRLKGRGITNPTEQQYKEEIYRIGMNPCAEIALSSKGVCNLTTVAVTQFVHKVGNAYVLDEGGLFEAQKLSARSGLRMTLVELEKMPWAKDPSAWDQVQQRDRLLGTSLTGWKDAISLIGYTVEQEKDLLRKLKEVARSEANRFASEMRVVQPLLVTTVKPEGTLSLVANACSSGLHLSHSPYYIRRIRINALDPLAKAVQEIGWNVNPEIGTPGETREEQLANARTLVIDFPISSGAKRSKDDSTIEEQFDTYFNFQSCYTEHNASNTIDVKVTKGEWEKAEQIVWDNWNDFTAVSFLAHDGGTYQLAPLEAITKEQYEELKSNFAPFDMTILQKHEVGQNSDDDMEDPSCGNGACGVR